MQNWIEFEVADFKLLLLFQFFDFLVTLFFLFLTGLWYVCINPLRFFRRSGSFPQSVLWRSERLLEETCPIPWVESDSVVGGKKSTYSRPVESTILQTERRDDTHNHSNHTHPPLVCCTFPSCAQMSWSKGKLSCIDRCRQKKALKEKKKDKTKSFLTTWSSKPLKRVLKQSSTQWILAGLGLQHLQLHRNRVQQHWYIHLRRWRSTYDAAKP